MKRQYVTKAWNGNVSGWESIDRESWDGSPLDAVDLSADDIGCKPGSPFLVELVESNGSDERVLRSVKVTAQ